MVNLSNFLQQNIFYIVVGIILLFVLFVLTLFIIKTYMDFQNEKKVAKVPNERYDTVLACLGGVKNINDVDSKKSRVIVTLANESLLNIKGLEKLDITVIGKSLIVQPEEVNKLVAYIDERKKAL
ncbi:MAG: hypothetical protein HUJ61_06570 [Bacilli bacterium]|nr:hypothetical protein [Bacilli bacterium]